jgi:hypothetical protein
MLRYLTRRLWGLGNGIDAAQLQKNNRDEKSVDE